MRTTLVYLRLQSTTALYQDVPSYYAQIGVHVANKFASTLYKGPCYWAQPDAGCEVCYSFGLAQAELEASIFRSAVLSSPQYFYYVCRDYDGHRYLLGLRRPLLPLGAACSRVAERQTRSPFGTTEWGTAFPVKSSLQNSMQCSGARGTLQYRLLWFTEAVYTLPVPYSI